MKELKDNSVDLIVTDPPYGLVSPGKQDKRGFRYGEGGKRVIEQNKKGFMGLEWDGAVPSVEIWQECIRVLKHGAFAFVMSIPRQDCLSRMIVNLEESGFDIGFTSLYHAFATGFPKAMNIGLSIDKRECRKQLEEKLGRKTTKEEFREAWKGFREVTGKDRKFGRADSGIYQFNDGYKPDKYEFDRYDKPVTKYASALDGSYAGYVRIPYKKEDKPSVGGRHNIEGRRIGAGNEKYGFKSLEEPIVNMQGRFPANLLVSDDILSSKKRTVVQTDTFKCDENDVVTCLKIVNIAEKNLNPTHMMYARDLGNFVVEVVVPNQDVKMENLMLGEILMNIIKSGTDNGEKKGVEKFTNNLKVDGFGKCNMEQFLPITISIIKTLTKIIIQLKILNSCNQINIGISMQENEKIIKKLMELNIENVSVVNNSNLLLNFISGEQVLIMDIVKYVVKKNYKNGKVKTGNIQENMEENIIVRKKTFHQRNIDYLAFSKFFSLDAWWEQRIKQLPKEVQKVFPFLIVPKASKGERDKGCEKLEAKSIANPFYENLPDLRMNRLQDRIPSKNIHVAVKPVKLMSYLITLGSREGDVVLDPFIGSGTTAIACRMLFRKFIGYEINKEYYDIAQARVKRLMEQCSVFEFGVGD